MQVLVVGGGGREHALAWKLAQSPRVERVFVAPGNAGTAAEPKLQNVPLAAVDIDALLGFARERSIALTVVGPEAPLVAGLVDRFDAAGLRCFGPSRAAARLEGSKTFSKAFMTRHGIPTAVYQSFTELDAALDYLRGRSLPLVIKADGLAAGKGVVIAQTADEARAAVTAMLDGGAFGEAGRRVVIEEFLQGEEASFIVIADGEDCLPMASSQDHKARDDGDRGPNTGGMGAYSPAPLIDDALHRQVLDDIIRPTLRGLAADGCRYRGFLYAGLMVGGDGRARVLEYNCRFGDPETQPIMLRLRSDLAELCLAACGGGLGDAVVDWDPRPALGVVLAAAGYPGDYRRGDVIEGLGAARDADEKLFHAGTEKRGDAVVSSGGRVLCATALGDDLTAARRRAYRLADAVRWDGAFCRRDIGYRALRRDNP